MAEYIVKDTELTSVANAIRSKSGGSESLEFPDGFVSEIEGIEKGYTIDEIATGISGDIVITSNTIRKHGFAFSNITSVIANNVTNLGSGNAVGIFEQCTNLTSLYMAELTSIGNSNDFCFNCTKLKTIYLPKIKDLGNRAFANCTSLINVAFPNAWGSYQTFGGCTKLEKVDYGAKGSLSSGINASNFLNCAKLTTLILRGETRLHNLSNINSFNGTPFASGKTGGTIYIPKELYDELGTGSALDYKSATNWSTVDAYGTITWAQIEGSIYETQYADGTLIPTS